MIALFYVHFFANKNTRANHWLINFGRSLILPFSYCRSHSSEVKWIACMVTGREERKPAFLSSPRWRRYWIPWCPSPDFWSGLSMPVYILVLRKANKEWGLQSRIEQRVAERTKGSTDKKSGAFEREKALGGFNYEYPSKRKLLMNWKRMIAKAKLQNHATVMFAALWISPNSLSNIFRGIG